MKNEDSSMASEEVPGVLTVHHRSSARSLLKRFTGTGKVSHQQVRSLSLAYLTAQQAGSGGGEPLLDEDALLRERFVTGGDKQKFEYNIKRSERCLNVCLRWTSTCEKVDS